MVQEIKSSGLLSGDFTYSRWNSMQDNGILAINKLGNAINQYSANNKGGTAYIPDSPIDNADPMAPQPNYGQQAIGAIKAVASMGKDGPTYPPSNADQAQGTTAVHAAVLAGAIVGTGIGGAAGSEEVVAAGSVKKVNPTGSMQNCTNCVYVVDNQLATGAKASALPMSKPLPFSQLNSLYNTQMSNWTTQGHIEQTLINSGNGTRRTIGDRPRLFRLTYRFLHHRT